MGNELSDMAGDAVADAVCGTDVDFEELQRSFENINLDESAGYIEGDGDAEPYGYDKEAEYDEEDDVDDDVPAESSNVSPSQDYEDEYEVGVEEEEDSQAHDVEDDGFLYDEEEGYKEDGVSDDAPEANQEEFAAFDEDDWSDVEIGETEDGLFDEDISALRNDASLLGEGGLDIYDSVEPMEPLDWDDEEFYGYDLNEISTATDIELLSLGYPPEPIPGTTTEDIMFTTEMMNESTVPIETLSPEMMESVHSMLDTQQSIVDSIRDLRTSLV